MLLLHGANCGPGRLCTRFTGVRQQLEMGYLITSLIPSSSNASVFRALCLTISLKLYPCSPRGVGVQERGYYRIGNEDAAYG